MSISNRSHTILNEVNALFPANPLPLVSEKTSDTLESQLTAAFETALQKGMPPMDALGIIMSWMSSEMMRIQVGQSRLTPL